MQIKLYATTTAGRKGFTFLNPDLALDQIAPLDGTIIVTIEKVQGDATDAQINYFRYVIVPALMSAAAKQGSDYTEKDAENVLLGKFANGKDLEQIAENGKKDMSILIDNCKLFLNEFFGIDLK